MVGCAERQSDFYLRGTLPVSYTHLDVYKRQLLVRSEGSSCARYSAYIPGGRLMTLVTPELERALRKCETAAKEAVRRECMQTLTGKWTCSLAELRCV